MEPPVDVIGRIIDDGVDRCSYERKLELTKNRPTPFLDLHLVDGKTTRKFQRAWYTKYEWLTGSTGHGKLFCYSCLLFGGDGVWGVDGVTTVKNFERKANVHSISGMHLRCQEKFKLFGRSRIDPALSDGQRLAALKYNEHVVGKNRRVLSRLIHAVCYLGRQGLTFRGRDECKTSADRGNYPELLDLLARDDRTLHEHLSSNSCFRGVSGDVHSDLVACVARAVNAEIAAELNRARFVSVQADETADVSCGSRRMSVILRYAVGGNVAERFVGFFDVSPDKSASGLSNVLLEAIKQWNIGDKIVCQTYDGAVLMAEQQNDVQAIIKETYPNAMFVHCYAHQLNLVFLHGAKTIRAVRLFVGDLTVFRTFFVGSPRRSELLREKGFNLPKKCETAWNYHSRAAATISAHFKELKRSVLCVSEERDWDPVSIALASGLLYKLSNFKFIYLLCLFKKIFVLSDRVSAIVQTKCTADVQTCVNEITHMFTKLAAMRTEETVSTCIQSAVELNGEIQFTDDDVKGLNDLTFEILDSIITQTNVRFQDFYFLKFLEITNVKAFKNYKECFPDEKLQELENHFPGVFDLQRLTNELTIIFEDGDKYLSPKELLNYIIKGDLENVYQEVTKFLQLALCIPVTAVSNDRNMTTLKRTKTFLRNTMDHNQLANLCTLAIEKKMLGELMIDPTFIDRVIDLFSNIKNRRIDLKYKVVI